MMEKRQRPPVLPPSGSRAGADKVLFHHKEAAAVPKIVELKSSFPPDGPLPVECTAGGAGHSPELVWSGVPKGTAALVLLVEDADSPTFHPFVHALASDLPPTDGEIDEGALGKAYRPPNPPAGHGPHRYYFQLYSMREKPGSQLKDRSDLARELKDGNCSGRGFLMGTYERK
jgi:hypothetical protein